MGQTLSLRLPIHRRYPASLCVGTAPGPGWWCGQQEVVPSPPAALSHGGCPDGVGDCFSWSLVLRVTGQTDRIVATPCSRQSQAQPGLLSPGSVHWDMRPWCQPWGVSRWDPGLHYCGPMGTVPDSALPRAGRGPEPPTDL